MGRMVDSVFWQGVKEGSLRLLSPQILAVMVIGNVISYVRYLTYFKAKTDIMRGELTQIPEMVWDGIRNQ